MDAALFFFCFGFSKWRGASLKSSCLEQSNFFELIFLVFPDLKIRCGFGGGGFNYFWNFYSEAWGSCSNFDLRIYFQLGGLTKTTVPRG